jgi:vacuolar protein sorting-associated protein 13A/C
LASDLGEGIKNTTTVFDNELTRVRFPRVIPFDRVLRNYNESESLGQYMLLDADDGAYCRDFYVGHVELRSEGNLFCVVSTHRIILINLRDHKSKWQIHFSTFKAIKTTYEGVTIYLQNDDLNERFLPLSDHESSNVCLIVLLKFYLIT